METRLLEKEVQKFVDYIDRAFTNRHHGNSFWIDEAGKRTIADVGYAEEWWNECMKPELLRVFN